MTSTSRNLERIQYRGWQAGAGLLTISDTVSLSVPHRKDQAIESGFCTGLRRIVCLIISGPALTPDGSVV